MATCQVLVDRRVEPVDVGLGLVDVQLQVLGHELRDRVPAGRFHDRVAFGRG